MPDRKSSSSSKHSVAVVVRRRGDHKSWCRFSRRGWHRHTAPKLGCGGANSDKCCCLHTALARSVGRAKNDVEPDIKGSWEARQVRLGFSATCWPSPATKLSAQAWSLLLTKRTRRRKIRWKLGSSAAWETVCGPVSVSDEKTIVPSPSAAGRGRPRWSSSPLQEQSSILCDTGGGYIRRNTINSEQDRYGTRYQYRVAR